MIATSLHLICKYWSFKKFKIYAGHPAHKILEDSCHGVQIWWYIHDIVAYLAHSVLAKRIVFGSSSSKWFMALIPSKLHVYHLVYVLHI